MSPFSLQLGRYRREKFLALEQAGCLGNKGSCPPPTLDDMGKQVWGGGSSGRAEVQVRAFGMLPSRLHGN